MAFRGHEAFESLARRGAPHRTYLDIVSADAAYPVRRRIASNWIETSGPVVSVLDGEITGDITAPVRRTMRATLTLDRGADPRRLVALLNPDTGNQIVVSTGYNADGRTTRIIRGVFAPSGSRIIERPGGHSATVAVEAADRARLCADTALGESWTTPRPAAAWASSPSFTTSRAVRAVVDRVYPGLEVADGPTGRIQEPVTFDASTTVLDVAKQIAANAGHVVGFSADGRLLIEPSKLGAYHELWRAGIKLEPAHTLAPHVGTLNLERRPNAAVVEGENWTAGTRARAVAPRLGEGSGVGAQHYNETMGHVGRRPVVARGDATDPGSTAAATVNALGSGTVLTADISYDPRVEIGDLIEWRSNTGIDGAFMVTRYTEPLLPGTSNVTAEKIGPTQ